MILKNKIVILGVKKKTKANFFETLKIGDIVEFQYDLNGKYKKVAVVSILKNGEEMTTNKISILRNNLSNFEYEDMEEA